ncbi:hypothetical protein [Actinophytocola gossypii]|uniref:Secreted protein n=1 Tax=Actinophytocola gossypii TaxID=2812003 RepID=A0ABT2J2S9_9PSEU|nr:hypothetical protein [Actinophytocola gossypii]MCT2582163.1 hypothetical protein [Actinophytocola gossypii]
MHSIRRALAGLAAITAVTLGLGLTTVGTAAAADGSWRAYGNTNPITSSSSTWKCGSTKTVAYSVLAQVCMVRSARGDDMQGAVIVRNNNRVGLFMTDASVSLHRPSGAQVDKWFCEDSGVAANSWSVCFGKTIAYPGATRAVGVANNVGLGSSPNI